MTIGEIAEKAGVSKSAVSRYLNQGYLSEDKREKIRAVIEETGYSPSRQAQQLRTGQTKLIGVILPKINSESVSRMVAGISQVLHQKGYQILLANTDNDTKMELSFLEVFRQDQVDGVILIATVLSAAHKRAIKNMPAPVVVLGQQADFCSSVYHDDFGAARELTLFLLSGGRHAVGYIGVTQADAAAGQARKAGFLQAYAESGLKVREELLLEGDFSVESGYENAARLLKENADLDGIFCATDFIAAGAMRYLKEAGKQIPEEISVAGIGHTQMSELLTPTLTTAHYHYKTSGREAASMLLEQIAAPEAIQREMKLGYRIVRQASTP